VVADRVESENGAQLRPQLVAREAWKKLGLGPLLEGHGFNANQIATAQPFCRAFVIRVPV